MNIVFGLIAETQFARSMRGTAKAHQFDGGGLVVRPTARANEGIPTALRIQWTEVYQRLRFLRETKMWFVDHLFLPR